MEYLASQLDAYESATQKEPKAKRALIQALYKITELSRTIEETIKDKATFEAHFEKCVSTKAKFNKEMAALSEALAAAKKDMDIVRNERKKRVSKSPKATVGGGAPRNTVILSSTDEDPAADKAPKKAAKAIKRKEKITPAMREEIWKKYIGREIDCLCPVCQDSTIKATKFSAGHIVAEAAGGVTNITNLVPICGNCNSRMSTTDLYEYTRKNYMRAPVFPGLKTI